MGIPAIVIAGTNSGCGKTTLTMGIMAALVEKGFKVQPYKVGPDYIDPMFHTFITGRESRNLDSWMLGRDTVKYLYGKNTEGADISIVEGVMGLYDGYGGSSLEGSTADVAGIIRAPVVLVINAEAMSLSAAALVKGFTEFDRRVRVKGVIINNISGEGHFRLLKEAIEGYTGIAVLGYLERSGSISIGSRHLGLVTSAEISGLKEKTAMLSKQIQRTIDLEQLVKLAGETDACSLQNSDSEEYGLKSLGADYFVKEADKAGNGFRSAVRIAVARDNAFCFYYKDSLEIMERMGAELVYFSPMNDAVLPEGIKGLYLGGGYPEVWAGELQENASMKKEIKSRIQKGLPAYAECGGLMYLTESIRTKEDSKFEMVGLIPGESRMTSSLKRFGYVHVKTTEDTILAKKASEIRAHEFHYSETIVEEGVKMCFEVSRRKDGRIVESWGCGYQVFNLLAGYPHMHFYANREFAKGFIDSCDRFRLGNT